MSVLFPVYIAGLLALALPWLLHRFSDQQPEERPFPSAQFLEPTAPPVSRTRKLKYWLLLTLRVLSVLLLCLLFMQPWLKTSGESLSATRHHMIAIDQSFSMRAGDRWQEAISQARQIMSDLPANHTMRVLGLNANAIVNTEVSDSAADPLDRLNRVGPGFAAIDYGAAMQQLNKLAANQSLPVKLWLISDFQRTSLPQQINALYAPEVEEFELVNIAEQSVANIHINANARSEDGVNMQLSVQLNLSESMNSSEERGTTITQSRVQILHDQRVLAERLVTWNNDSLESLFFNNLTLPPGQNPILTVRVSEPDAIVEDNEVKIVVQQPQPTPIALLKSRSNDFPEAAVFLTTAFETDAIASMEAVTGQAEMSADSFSHLITGQDINLENLSIDLLNFVDGNRNALVFHYSDRIASENPVLKGSEVGWLDESHPINLGAIDWLGVEFYELQALELKTNDRVLLETASNQPLLIERATTRGTLLLLNDRLDGVSSNLPFHPAFVSLMQAILSYFDASLSIPETITVGERVAFPGYVQLLDSENEPLLKRDSSGGVSAWLAEEPGLYTVVSTRGEQMMRVTTQAKESDLSAVDEQSLVNWQQRYTSPKLAQNNASSDTNDTIQTTDILNDETTRFFLDVAATTSFCRVFV